MCLIDCSSVSYEADEINDEIERILRTHDKHGTFLVLDATMRLKEMLRVFDATQRFSPEAVVFTKMDLASNFGSIFDFITFFVLLKVLRADETLFRSGWFVESLVTQILVIFVIRSRRSCFASRPGLFLTVLSMSMVVLACLLVFLPVNKSIGFAPLPVEFFVVLASIALVYLSIVEIVKHFFYRTILKVDAGERPAN